MSKQLKTKHFHCKAKMKVEPQEQCDNQRLSVCWGGGEGGGGVVIFENIKS